MSALKNRHECNLFLKNRPLFHLEHRRANPEIKKNMPFLSRPPLILRHAK